MKTKRSEWSITSAPFGRGAGLRVGIQSSMGWASRTMTRRKAVALGCSLVAAGSAFKESLIPTLETEDFRLDISEKRTFLLLRTSEPGVYAQGIFDNAEAVRFGFAILNMVGLPR